MSDVFRLPPTAGLFGSRSDRRMVQSDGESLDDVISRVAGDVAAKVSPAIAGHLKAKHAAASKPKAFSAQPKSTHLDAVSEYLENHADYATAGISLESHVEDYFVNTPDANEPTDAILQAVKKQSDMLAERWASGAVKDPWK